MSDRMIAAVTAAPVPALTAAIIANVALDILAGWRAWLHRVKMGFIPFVRDKRKEKGGNDDVRRG